MGILTAAAYRLRDVAAEETFLQIRRDRERAPRTLVPLLVHIEQNLFDPDLNASGLLRACGIRDKSIAGRFRAALGHAPYGYIEHCRLEVARRLLARPELKVWEIADLLGYSQSQVFSDAFLRLTGERPLAYRRRTRRPGKGRPKAKNDAPSDSPARGEELVPGAPGEFGAAPSRAPLIVRTLPGTDPERIAFERIQAEELWPILLRRSPEERHEMVRHQVRFRTPALYQLLEERIYELGREDRNVGVSIAELAVASVDALEDRDLSPINRLRLKIRAQLELANAYRSAGRLEIAAGELAAAARMLPLAHHDQILSATYFMRRANLFQMQSKHQRALADLKYAVPMIYASRPEKFMETWIAQAIAYINVDRPEDAIELLNPITRFIHSSPNRYLLYTFHATLANAYVRAERYDDAARMAEQTYEAAASWSSSSNPKGACRMLGARIYLATGDLERSRLLLKENLYYCKKAGEAISNSVIYFHLAHIQLLKGRRSRAMDLFMEGAKDADKTFSSSSLKVRRLIDQAAKDRSITRESLQELCRSFTI